MRLIALLGFERVGIRVDIPGVDVALYGMRGTMACYVIRGAVDIAATARLLRSRIQAQLQLYVFIAADVSQVCIATFAFGEKLLALTLQRDAIHHADIGTLHELMPEGDCGGSALAAQYARVLDRVRVTRRFFSDFAAQRDLIAAAWTAPSLRQQKDREQLALILLSRLMFLYFLQHRGHLANDPSYLLHKFLAHESRRRTFYSGVLEPLFFYVLNRRKEKRPARASCFGDLPYLNGGLFERHALERKHPRLDLPNDAMAKVFEHLLERYRFTTRDASDVALHGIHDAGVDPEMLGRVFEGLMAERVRETTGTFYTPAATVDKLVRETLGAYLAVRPRTIRALRDLRILDPACGSGAFLLGALARISDERAALENMDAMEVRRDVVARSLFGVDVQGDAALLCALRLWLALVPPDGGGAVQPLPNLDRKIRQGDSLVDPLDLAAGAQDPAVHRCIAKLSPAASAYALSGPDERPALQRSLQRAESLLARVWIGAQQRRLRYGSRELRALAGQRDLFGATTVEAHAARRDLAQLRLRAAEVARLARGIRLKEERPFFSFAVHFPDVALRGFDIVLCNPPWVRTHNWPQTLTAAARGRFTVCAPHHWRPPGIPGLSLAGGNQIDLALLFLERALDLLVPGGALGIILPAKFMRSLSGGTARRLLLERSDIISIEDHSLDQRSIFHADAFASVIVARKRADTVTAPSTVRMTMVRRGVAPREFAVPQAQLPLFRGDAQSPWLLVPPDVRRVVDRMRVHPMIGEYPDLKVQRGVVTGSNGIMLLTNADRKLSGLAAIRSEGFSRAATPALFEGVIEECAIARVARGCDIRAWQCAAERFMICKTPATVRHLPRLERYLARHQRSLSDVPRVNVPQSVIAWHDLASTLNAVVLPDRVAALNTVYFIAAGEHMAHVLAAFFNSLPVRTLARVMAERAKDAHFRFFAWTVAMLPLPPDWNTAHAAELRVISHAAHERGSIADQSELDELVCRCFGLSKSDLRVLADFDAWLCGR